MDLGARIGRHLSSRDAAGPARGVALVLHGGKVSGSEPVTPYQLAVIRVALLAAGVHRQVAGQGIAVWNLRFSVRGWNGEQASPAADALWALEQIRLHAGVPVVIIGHSMGGRTALRVAGHDSVRGVVALAPWLPDGEPVAQLAGRHLLVAHGDRDRITDPAGSARYVARAAPVAASARLREVTGDGHAMLRKPLLWHRLAARGALDILAAPAPGALRPAPRAGS